MTNENIIYIHIEIIDLKSNNSKIQTMNEFIGNNNF